MSIKSILIFIAGAAAGSIATYLYMKPAYQEVSVETKFEDAPKSEEKKAQNTPEKPNLIEYTKKASQYVSYSNVPNVDDYPIEEEEEEEEDEEASEDEEESDPEYEEVAPVEVSIRKKPRIIKPNMFGNRYPNTNGDMVQPLMESLTMFSDGVIINDEWDVVNDIIDENIGYDNLSPEHFEEYDSGVVYIRNDNYDVQTDYEIVSDPRTYKSISRSAPIED